MGQTNKQQRHFNEWLISELRVGGRFHPNQLKTTFYLPAIMECRLCSLVLSARVSLSQSLYVSFKLTYGRGWGRTQILRHSYSSTNESLMQYRHLTQLRKREKKLFDSKVMLFAREELTFEYFYKTMSNFFIFPSISVNVCINKK